MSDKHGHWVIWTKGESKGSLSPYVDLQVAENVLAAKQKDLLKSPGTPEE
jgi:hypothetical protein